MPLRTTLTSSGLSVKGPNFNVMKGLGKQVLTMKVVVVSIAQVFQFNVRSKHEIT
jgi:hypothetical protein